mgnify:CR=1 FL=1
MIKLQAKISGEFRSHAALIAALADVCADGMRGQAKGHRISEIKYQAVAFSDALVARIPRDAPAVMLTDTAPFRYPYYHLAQDTPDKLDFISFSRATLAIDHVIETLTAP